MKNIDPELAIADIGNSKIALVVANADTMERANALTSHVACKAIVVQKFNLAKDKNNEGQGIEKEEVRENQLAEALRKARERAEKKSKQRVRKLLLLVAEPELLAISPQATEKGQEMQPKLQAGAQIKAQKKWKKLNSIALDRNKRPLALYAMLSEKWKSYERIASFAGVKIVGFIFPPIAVGNALIAQNYERETRQEGLKEFAKSFIVLDLGARYTSIAMFTDGLPCAIATIEFGSENFNEALIEAFQLSSERAEQLKNSLCFSENLLNSYSEAITKQKNKGEQESSRELKRKTHEELIEIKRIFPRNIKVAKNPLAQRKDAQGAERILAPIYEKAMQKVIRMFDNLAPRFSENAPVYMCGGGAAIPGIQTLTAHLLKRCVFPALLPRVNGTAIRAPIHSISALAGLFAVGQEYTENKVGKNTARTQVQKFNFSQQESSSGNFAEVKAIGDMKNNLMVNAKANKRVNEIANEEKTHA